MNKFHGKIGFAKTEETSPGVWTPSTTEKTYVGDIIKNHQRWQSNENVNDDLVLSNEVSIVADLFANSNAGNIRYVEWQDTKWRVTKVEVKRPRLILTLGGVYNE